MPYTLNSTTLPNPRAFRREMIETAVMHRMIDGTDKKDITNRKEMFILSYENITQAQLNTILGIWNLLSVVDFQVNETNLTINATSVHVDVKNYSYQKGGSYLTAIDLILTEVV